MAGKERRQEPPGLLVRKAAEGTSQPGLSSILLFTQFKKGKSPPQGGAYLNWPNLDNPTQARSEAWNYTTVIKEKKPRKEKWQQRQRDLSCLLGGSWPTEPWTDTSPSLQTHSSVLDTRLDLPGTCEALDSAPQEHKTAKILCLLLEVYIGA